MIRTIAGDGSQGFGGDGGLATDAQLYNPAGIAVGQNGDIYITDSENHRIRKITKSGFISTIAGDGHEGFSGDGSLATKARLCSPCGIAVSESGEIFIADTGNDTIRKVALSGLISTIAGNGEYGFSGDGGPATNAQLRNPQGIAVGSNGEIYIADRDNHRISKIAPNGTISTIAGSGSEGGFSGDGGWATHARLYYPQGIALSESGEIYIADAFNSRIRKIALDGKISTIAGNGKPGFSGDGGLATNAQLFHPQGIALSENGKLYIADRNNHRIRKVTPDGLISTVAGNGERGFSGDGGLAIHARLNYPCGIALSSNGAIYIADSDNGRIRKIDGLCPNDLYLDGTITGTSLKKYERDHASEGLVCFQPLLAKLTPTFYESIFNAKTHLNANEKQIAQQLIDSFMYGAELDLDGLESATVVDWLFVLGMIEGREFFEVKTKLLSKFMETLTEDSIPVVLERLDNLKERSDTENRLLSQVMDYTLGRAALMLKVSSNFSANPIIQKHLVQIAPKLCLTEVAPIILAQTSREESKGIESLFNDPKTSDIKIRLGEKLFCCHRTVLSSYSPYFEVLFDSGDSFNDLEGGTYRVDYTEFGEESHEAVIKYCYNLFKESDISDSMVILLFKCASFYGLTQPADRCVDNINLSTGNYFELVEQLGEYPCEALCTKLVEFGFANLKSLDMTQEKLFSLPEQIKQQLLWKCVQEQVRK